MNNCVISFPHSKFLVKISYPQFTSHLNMEPQSEGFCDDPLWDINITWNTDNPDFTTCFHQTVLLYIPSAILILFYPFSLWSTYKSPDRLVPWTIMNRLKFALNMALIIIPMIDLGYAVGNEVSSVHVVAAVVKIISYCLTLGLNFYQLRQGVVTSGVLFFFWFLQAVCGAFTFRSVLSTDYVVGDDRILPFTTYVIQYPIIVAMFFMNCFADAKPKAINLEDNYPNLTPEKYASFLSRMFFSWFDGLSWQGWKRLLTEKDMWTLMKENRSTGIIPVWDKYWEKHEEKCKDSKKEVSIVSTLFYAFAPAYAISAVFQFGYSTLQFASPQIVNALISFVSSDEPNWKGYFYTALICAVTLINTLLNSQTFYWEYAVGLRVKTALISAIYRKSVKLSSTGRSEMTVGETTNLMSIDTQKFMDLMLYGNMIWASPLQIALSVYFLWQQLGPSTLAGLAVMILMIPLNGVVATKMKKYQISQMKDKDKRCKLMDEILNGIKVLKLYAWEKSFQGQVTEIRKHEAAALIKAAYMNAFTSFLWTSAPFLVALASFTTYVLIDENNILDANTAFVSLTLFNLLRIPLNILPMLIVFMVQVQVSVQRINKFMRSNELDPDAVSHKDDYEDPVVVRNASFTWGENKNVPASLKNVNITVKQGQLVGVVGSVGSGKSSLISALLGEMKTVSGTVNTQGKIAYVPQQAWLQNATLKYNITFGKKINKELYERVLEACALLTDLEMLPGGDQIEIGEKGINLSGGQKQRISMARSVYSNGNLYFLDDPLSAVDSHVGKHIFEKVIGPDGLLKRKTRILCTNSVAYLSQMDQILVMKEGRIAEQGTYEQLLADGGEFADFLVQYLTEEGDKDGLDPQTETELEDLKTELEKALGKEKLQKSLSVARSVRTTLTDLMSNSSRETPKHGNNIERNLSVVSEPANTRGFEMMQAEEATKSAATGANLIESEKLEIGGVKWDVYTYYAKSIGWLFSIGTFVLYGVYQGFSLGSNIWLSSWSTDPLAIAGDVPTRNKYLTVYGVLGLLQAIFVMMATSCVMIGTLIAATKLHSRMLERILYSPMSFFDTTPLGRILNRFSKDMDIMDVTIPMNFRMLCSQLYNVVGTIVVICYTIPIFTAVVIPIAIMYYLLQKFYVSTARQVKRLESITRSPIYSHFGETISGAPTIRAYGKVTQFIKESEDKVDLNQMCYYPTYISSRWLSVRLESVGNLIILFTSLFAVLARGTIDAGDVGLALSYSLNVTGALNMLVRMTSEIETNMVSVERIIEYQNVTQEAPYELPDQDPPKDWPQYGVVKFDKYQTRYREGLDLVLKGIDVEIMSGEKIGIVGRTGAGKSSLTLALFRIVEAAGGSILIDGQNIGFLGLSKLRSRLTIIPQDPVLFSGSMRMNLDPFNQYSDKNVWDALEHAHLKSFVSNLPGGMNFQVSEGGSNLSVGQRQLVCLARALLRKTKVLILDEATAAVDLETDDLIQATIREEFADCTVLTIAHRLNTIMDSSRVMVLDAGKIKEFDTPEALLNNKKTVFYGMAKDAGLVGNNQYD